MLLTLKAMKRRESEIGSYEKATKLFLGLYNSYLNHTIMTYRILRAMRLQAKGIAYACFRFTSVLHGRLGYFYNYKNGSHFAHCKPYFYNVWTT